MVDAEIAQQVLSQSRHDMKCLNHLRKNLQEARHKEKTFREEVEKERAEFSEKYVDSEIAFQILSQSRHDMKCLNHLRKCL